MKGRLMKQDDTTKGVIPIFFTINDAYAPYMGIAVHSIMSGASRDFDYDIVIMHQELSEKNVQKLKSMECEGFHFRFVPMEGELEGITNRHCNKLRQDYFTLTIFFRLFIPEMFPEYDKGIYLDSDIVVPGDISSLFNVDLGDNLIGACRDLSIRNVPELVAYTNKGVGVGIENYINSGVLLMNLRKLRECGLERRFLELLTTYHFDNVAPDQDYLNVLCHNKIAYLDPSWDAMPVIGEDPMEFPNLIHYNLFAKPWCYDDIPYEDYFWYYANESPFRDEAKENRDKYSEEQKASDEACMKQLLAHGQEIADAPFNFRVVFESGQEARL